MLLLRHIPIATGDRLHLSAFITNEAYESRFTESPMSYVSDSLMEWRQAHPHQPLDEGKPFQFPARDAAFRAAKASRTLRAAGGA